VAVMALADPIVFALFGEKYASAPLFLALVSINYLLTAFGQLSTLNLISGQGKTRFYLELAIINTVTGIVLAVLLVPTFKVVGLIITTIFDGVPGLFVSLYWIKNHYGASVDWVSSGKIVASSAVAGVIAYLAVSFVSLSDWPKLALGIVVFAAVFLLAIIATRTLKKPDIDT
jgi:O-antigen/teichoic acid export membrane protein